MGTVITFPSQNITSQPDILARSNSANWQKTNKLAAARAQRGTAPGSAEHRQNNVVLLQSVFVEYEDNKCL